MVHRKNNDIVVDDTSNSHESTASTSKQIETKPAPKRKLFRWLALAVGLSFSLVVLMLLVFYFTLRSGSLTQSAVPKLKPYLAPLGIELTHIGSLRFDLLKSITLEDLSLNWSDPEMGDLALTIDHFNIEYRLSDLFDQRFEISEMILQNVKIKSQLRLPETAAQTPITPVTEDTSLDFKKIEALLKNPPLVLSAKNIAIKNIELDVHLVQADTVVSYQGALSEAKMELLWEPERLTGLVALSLGETRDQNRLKVISQQDEKTMILTVSPSLQFLTQWRLENHLDQWQLSDSQLNVNAKLENIHVVEDDKTHETTLVSLALVDFQLNNDFASSTPVSSATGMENIFPLTLSSQLSSNLDDLILSEFQQEDMLMSATLNHQFNLVINGQINPFITETHSALPEIAFKLHESLGFNGLDLTMAEQKITINQFNWTLNSAGETLNEKNAAGLVIRMDADAKMDRVNVKSSPSKEDDSGTGKTIELSLVPELNLTSTAKLTSFDQPLETLVAQLSPEIVIKNLSATIKAAKQVEKYRLDEARINLTSRYDKQQINLDSTLTLNGVNVPELKKTVSLENKIAINTQLTLDTVSLTSQTGLNKTPLFDLSLDVDNQPNKFALKHQVNLNLSPTLSDYHDAAKELAIVGDIQLSLSGDTQIQHQSNDIQSADFSDINRVLKQVPLETKGKVIVSQVKAPMPIVDEAIVLSGPVTFDYTVDNQRNYQVDFNLDVAGIQTPPLAQALPLRIKSQNNLTWPLSKTTSIIGIEIAKDNVLDLELTAKDNKEFLALATKISLNANPKWQKYLADLKPLDMVGVLQTQIEMDAKIKHPFNSILDFDPDSLDKILADVSLNTRVSQDQMFTGSMVKLAKTVSINQQINWSAGHAQWQADASVPDLLLPDVLALNDIQTRLTLTANSGFTPNQAALTINVEEGGIRLLSTEQDAVALAVGHILTPLSLKAQANWTEALLNLDELNVNLGHDLLSFQTSGSASLDGKNAQFEAKIISRLRDKMFNSPAVSGAGGLAIPLRLTLLEGEQFALEGEVKFDHFHVSIDDLSIQNLNGSFQLEEELLIEHLATDTDISPSAKFRYLLDPNPFQRVDFSRIQPYLNTSSISIDKVQVGEQEVGPILASVLLKQNIFSLPQFDVDLFSGHSAGQFYLDVRPKAWKLGLLSRVTNLDPRQLLAKNSKLRQSELSPINTRTAIEFDIHKRLMEGQIVVSQINRDQLLQLLDVVDPAHEDEQMAQLRKALRFSHPELVQVDMQRGLMNLKVEISRLPKAIRVTGIPLTPMIQQFASELLADIDQIPLQ